MMDAHVILPSSSEAERSVLGAVLVDSRYLAEVAQVVTPEDFYFPANRNLFRSMLEMDRAGTAIDPLTLAERHEADGEVRAAGGAAYVSKLLDGIPRLVNARHYAQIVSNAAKRRRLIHFGYDLVQQAADGVEDPDAYAAEMGQALLSRHATDGPSGFMKADKVLESVLDDLEARRDKPGLAGVSSGYPDIDQMTDGWKGGQLVVVGGTASMGKTSLVLSMAAHASKTVPVAIFSMEMSCSELGKRLVSMIGRVPAGAIRSGQMTDLHWSKAAWAFQQAKGLRLYVDQSDSVTVPQMMSRCRALKQQAGLSVVVVDYIQLVEGRNADNEEQHVNAVTRSLKRLARALDVTVIAITSLNKKADERDGGPQLGDIRGSGSVNFHADIISFVYRPAVQKRRLEKKVEPYQENLGLFLITKQRNGPTGDVKLTWNDRAASFESYAKTAHEVES